MTTAASAQDPTVLVFASPLARRLSKEAGLDIGALKGSGPHGRIIERDVQAALAGGARAERVQARARALGRHNQEILRAQFIRGDPA